MNSLKQNLFLSIALIILLYAVGFVIYSHLEGWSFVDSIYFQTMTFTTIGYGDIVPLTDEGKLFTVLISWIGISIAFFVLYTISTYRERVVDKKITTLIGRIPKMLPNGNNKKKK